MRLSGRRRWTGLALAVAGPPLEAALLSTARPVLALGSVLLLYLPLVVHTAAVGGLAPGMVAAIASFLLANWFFVPPFHTFTMESRDSVIELIVFLVVAVIVAVTVHLAAREQANAARSRFESQLLARFNAERISDLAVTEVLEEVRATFGMDSAALVRAADTTVPRRSRDQWPRRVRASPSPGATGWCCSRTGGRSSPRTARCWPASPLRLPAPGKPSRPDGGPAGCQFAGSPNDRAFRSIRLLRV